MKTDSPWRVRLTPPGGPGGSGIRSVLHFGLDLQQIVDASVDVKPMPLSSDEAVPRYFDIIGFDPRGVNNTTPPLTCFPNAFERLSWNLQAQDDGLIGLAPDAFAKAWARAKALGQSCGYGEASSRSKSGKSIGNFMNTTPVIRDMVEMIERHGQWREEQARQWLASKEAKQAVIAATGTHDYYRESAVVQRTRWARGHERLLYWGFSYGTTIGTTFTAMYPNRVGRVILDGVVDSYAYYNSSAVANIQDADKALDHLLQLCFDSGSRVKCGLYDPRGADEIKSKLFSIIDSVKENPFPVPPSGTRGPQLITASDIDLALHLSLYEPLELATQFFHAMYNLSSGDGSWFAKLKQDSMTSDIAAPPESCKDAALWTPECQISGVLDTIGGMGIECTDGRDLQDRSPETFKAYWELLNNTSKLMGSRRAIDRLHCTHWEMRPKWRFTGKW
jgi:pimeloyl-ACP methyl ester carboxylesterase